MRPTAMLSAAVKLIAHEVLEDDADVGAQREQVVFAQVVPVEQDAALVRIVEAREQLDQRGLAGAVLADQREDFSGVQLEGQIAHRPALGAGIAEADVLEREAALDRHRERPRIRRRHDLGLDLEERKQIVEVERLARDLREADQQVLQQIAQAPERAGEKRQIADREIAVQRAPHDVRVRDVVGERADRGQHAAPAGAPHRDLPVGCEEARGERAVALDQERVQAEDLHFLGRFDARAGLPHVIELAPLGRPREVERIALRVEVRLADERRHQRDREQHDQPRCEDEQAGRKADDGDHVLRLAEQLADQARCARRPAGARAPGGPAARCLRSLRGRASRRAPSAAGWSRC